ncbi:MAG: SpoVR family protein [Thermoplasmata archaeon]
MEIEQIRKREREIERQLQKEVWAIKELAEKKGLKFCPVNFEIITKKAMVEFGTYVLPSRYSHWTFGKDFGKLQKLHELGILQILEMVINTEPAVAFLLDSNTLIEHRMVIAHVFAHVDFFTNNYWFSKTNKNMLAESEYAEKRVAELEYEYGKEEIEKVLDACLSMQWHVDFYSEFRPKVEKKKVIPRLTMKSLGLDLGLEEKESRDNGKRSERKGKDEEVEKEKKEKERYESKYGKSQNRDVEREEGKKKVGNEEGLDSQEVKEEKDLLKYLIRNAPLKDYEMEILEIVREESLYFMPNALTKIMNEGWATYWHVELMREYLSFEEFQSFAQKHAELMAADGLNPYKLGYMIYDSIVKRWDKEYGKGEGLKKIFEVRQFEDDVSFINNYLTQEICDACGLFIYEEDPYSGERRIKSTKVEDIKKMIISQIMNFGKPVIVVKNGDYRGNRELYLVHKYDGRELDRVYTEDVLKSIFRLWRRPVHVETVYRGKKSLFSYDGKEHSLRDLE